MKIGFRIIKTVIAVVLSMYMAYWLGLDEYTYAGVVAALSMQTTRQQSVRVSLQMFASAILSLIVSTLVFWLFGFHLWITGMLLLLIIPVLVRLHIERGVIISLVIILLVYHTQTVASLPQIGILYLLVTGMGVSLLINLLYMPDATKKLEQLRQRHMQETSQVFSHMYRHLTEKNYIWSGKELLTIEEILKEGKDVSLVSMENQLLRNEDPYYTYFRREEKRFDIIQRMVLALSRINTTFIQTHMLSEVFQLFSQQLHEGKLDTDRLLKHLRELEQAYKQMELPKTRLEFEVRSAALQLLRELELYLLV
ncbi:MAG: aromatic acid exporter family protein [Bacillaceae bacterium]|nr:aromatic acid exporter family protein [Bacillaceae bacterium]